MWVTHVVRDIVRGVEVYSCVRMRLSVCMMRKVGLTTKHDKYTHLSARIVATYTCASRVLWPSMKRGQLQLYSEHEIIVLSTNYLIDRVESMPLDLYNFMLILHR